MEPWVWVALAAVGTFLGWSVWLFYAGRSVGAAPILALELRLKVTEDRLESARVALASEIEDAKARSQGARSDFAKDRELRDAVADPDDDVRRERLLRFFPPGEAATSGESSGEAD